MLLDRGPESVGLWCLCIVFIKLVPFEMHSMNMNK